MDKIRRVAIDEHLPAPNGEDPGLPGKVRNLSALKAIAVGLDHVVNRSLADMARWGHVDPGTQAANEADFVEARKQLRILEIGIETGRAMLAAIEAQPGVAPESTEPSEPKKTGRRQTSQT